MATDNSMPAWGFKPKRKTKAQKRADRERKVLDRIGGRDGLRHQVAVDLLSQGFLNEALARGKRTTPAKDFYSSREWASARYAALIRSQGRCSCCGASRADGAVMHVDHIKPRSKFPELALVLENLQVLCDLCNVAKSNIDMTDWTDVLKDDDPRGESYRVYREEERRVFQFVRDIANERDK